MDIFIDRTASPMLIAEMQEPFDNSNYIYELKLDGERCLAYLDSTSTILQNKRQLILNHRFPELAEIHRAVKHCCILDGELAVLVDGKPSFEEVKRRSLLSNQFRINIAAGKYPACFTVFDILYDRDHPVTDLPLMDRKSLLKKVIRQENGRLAVSRYIEGKGKALYEAAARQGLEGVVAKRKDSLYRMGARTRDWIKFKNLIDEDYIVCGYIKKEGNVVSIVLGQYQGDRIVYRGHVTLGVSREDFQVISWLPENDPPFSPPKGNENAVWVEPSHVCTVKYMEKTSAGGLRQPVYKGLREDKDPRECVVK